MTIDDWKLNAEIDNQGHLVIQVSRSDGKGVVQVLNKGFEAKDTFKLTTHENAFLD